MELKPSIYRKGLREGNEAGVCMMRISGDSRWLDNNWEWEA